MGVSCPPFWCIAQKHPTGGCRVSFINKEVFVAQRRSNKKSLLLLRITYAYIRSSNFFLGYNFAEQQPR